ncbi:hypothetical protein [Comamonas badia]|uniref:hypothetical protein n=1 Tax=Comamonas badia TaxID=265291 RepID=UPI0004281E12|nr:hypothetical protein [Comamonas badia]
MLQVDINKLEQLIEDLRSLLKDGLAATDIWDRSTGLSLAGYNAQPAAVALFNQLTGDLVDTLSGAGFPKLNRYYLLDLDADNAVVIMRHGDDLLQGALLNSKKVNMGILFSIAIPKAIDAVAKART